MQRRRLLFQLTQAAAALAWQQVFAPGVRAQGAQVGNWSASGEVFTLGVASGEPRPDSVVLWTRLAPKPLEPDGGMPPHAVAVQWQVATDHHFTHVVQMGLINAEPDAAHSVHVEVKGLRAGWQYFYRFEAGGQRSATGRTRTAPEPSAQNKRLRLAVASCQHYEAGYFVAHRDMAAADIDLLVFVGDYIYETEVSGVYRLRQHPHAYPRYAAQFTLQDYRLHHASYKLDSDLQANHAAHPWLLVWDDHEVLNDYTGQASRELPDRLAFLQLRTAAYRAYFEHMPVSPSRAPIGPLMRMHGYFEWGQLAEFWTIDGRQFRDRPACAGWHAPQNGGVFWHCKAAADEQRTMLGTEQEDWLAQGLAASTRDWKFIVQPTQIAPGLFKTPIGALSYADGWDAFPAARARLMSAIAQPRVPDVVCLGGDVHRHVAANLRLDPADLRSPIVASEFVVSSVSTKGLGELLNNWMKANNPDLLHMRSDQRGYMLLDITPQQVVCEFKGTPHPVKADARLSTQARYVVERGVPGPRKA